MLCLCPFNFGNRLAWEGCVLASVYVSRSLDASLWSLIMAFPGDIRFILY